MSDSACLIARLSHADDILHYKWRRIFRGSVWQQCNYKTVDMKEKNTPHYLDDNAKLIIEEVFHDKMVPKLTGLGARLGNINCGFAGSEYDNWSITFKSSGSDFYIDGFEYDEDGTSFDFDL